MSDWKKKQSQDLRETETSHRETIDGMDMFSISLETASPEDHVDERDFSDRCYYDFNTKSGVVKKEILKFECEDNEDPEIPPDMMCVILNYKMRRAQGKRNPLAGNHLLHVPVPKHPLRLPLHQARKFFLEGLRACDAIEDMMAELDLEMKPEEK